MTKISNSVLDIAINEVRPLFNQINPGFENHI